MKKLSILLVLLLTSCNSIFATPTATPTETPRPTATSTPKPTATITLTPTLVYKELPLREYITQPGDLPTGYNPGQISFSAPQMFSGIPKADHLIDMRFEKDGGSAGGVTVFLYYNTDEAEEAFDIMVHSMGEGSKIEVGDGYKGAFSTSALALPFADVVIVSCNTVIYCRITDSYSAQPAIKYIGRILAYLKDDTSCVVYDE